MPGRIASARQFLALALRPFTSLTLDVLGGLGFLGLQFSLYHVGDAITAVVVALGLGVVLFAVAGYRLQRTLDLLNLEHFTTTPMIDPTTSEFQLPNDPRIWTTRAVLMLEVRNEGPSARFAASIDAIDEVERELGGLVPDYRVDEVAWENSLERVNEIPSGASARLKIATAGRWMVGRDQGDSWFFWTARSASYAPNSHGVGWRLRAPDHGIVSLRITVVNVDANQRNTEEYAVEFWASAPRSFRKQDRESTRSI